MFAGGGRYPCFTCWSVSIPKCAFGRQIELANWIIYVTNIHTLEYGCKPLMAVNNSNCIVCDYNKKGFVRERTCIQPFGFQMSSSIVINKGKQKGIRTITLVLNY